MLPLSRSILFASSRFSALPSCHVSRVICASLRVLSGATVVVSDETYHDLVYGEGDEHFLNVVPFEHFQHRTCAPHSAPTVTHLFT